MGAGGELLRRLTDTPGGLDLYAAVMAAVRERARRLAAGPAGATDIGGIGAGLGWARRRSSSGGRRPAVPERVARDGPDPFATTVTILRGIRKIQDAAPLAAGDAAHALRDVPGRHPILAPAATRPDGRRIAFESDADTDGDMEIYVMDADGGGVLQLTRNGGPRRGPRAGRPTARGIAFTWVGTRQQRRGHLDDGGRRQRSAPADHRSRAETSRPQLAAVARNFRPGRRQRGPGHARPERLGSASRPPWRPAVAMRLAGRRPSPAHRVRGAACACASPCRRAARVTLGATLRPAPCARRPPAAAGSSVVGRASVPARSIVRLWMSPGELLGAPRQRCCWNPGCGSCSRARTVGARSR